MKKESKRKLKKERQGRRYAEMVEQLHRERQEWKRKQRSIKSLDDAMML